MQTVGQKLRLSKQVVQLTIEGSRLEEQTPKKEISVKLREEEPQSMVQPKNPEEQMLLMISKFSPDVFVRISRLPP